MRAAVVALALAVSSPGLAQQADCDALRAGRPFQLTSSGRSQAGEAMTLVEQYRRLDGNLMEQRYRVGDRLTVATGPYTMMTEAVTSGGGRRTFSYSGVDPSADHFAGDRPLSYRVTQSLAVGRILDNEIRAQPSGTDTVTVSGCRFAVRLWTLEARPVGEPGAEPSIIRYAYAPELRALLRRGGAGPGGARPYEFTASEITTSFTPFQ